MPTGIYKRTKWHREISIKNSPFKKGHKSWNKDTKGLMPIPWNKGTKGICKANSGSFKKGHPKSPASSKFPKGKKHYRWKGKKRQKQGYIFLHKPNHPFANTRGYIFEHRYVMEQLIRRYLLPKERVHHINEIKNDNRIENLKLFSTHSEHLKFHHQINGSIL